MADTRFQGAPLTRRHALAGGGALVVGTALAGCSSSDSGSGTGGTESAPAADGTDGVCVLSPEVTEGPYYLDGQLVREDITEGKQGFPLAMAITVVDYTDGCTPMSEDAVAVEIWHCDAWGYYSGYTDAGPGGQVPEEDGEGDEMSFLRGIRLVDGDGTAYFSTVVPGWYSPRVTHVHLKVHVGGQADTTYEGGTTVHTGQLLFADDFCAEVAERAPYSEHVLELTPVEEDQVYQEAQEGEGDPGSLVVSPVPITEGTPENGYTLSVTVGITPEESTTSGGAPGQGEPGGGTSGEGAPGEGGSPPEGGPGAGEGTAPGSAPPEGE